MPVEGAALPIWSVQRSQVRLGVGGEISKIKRLKKSQKKGGFGVDLPSGFWALMVTCLLFCYNLAWNSGLVAHESRDSHLSTCRRELGFQEKLKLSLNLWSNYTSWQHQVSSTTDTRGVTPGVMKTHFLPEINLFMGESAQLLPMAEKYLLYLEDGQGYWADSKDASFTFQCSRWKITSPTLFAIEKKLFSYVVCAVWSKKRPHSLWLLWMSGW